MDPILLIELGIVAFIIGLQFVVFFRNLKTIELLGKIYPSSNQLKVDTAHLITSEEDLPVLPDAVDLVEDSPTFSETFRAIIKTTNDYLIRNKGAADFDILKELAERKSASKQSAIDSNIALPLYIGLLCTFTGVIIGLIKISIVGVTDSAIQSFIGGVLIGMIGSATGLALTVRSNFSFKDSKTIRDQEQYNYFTFLRTHILPIRQKEATESLSSLRTNLSAFNEGFVQYQKHMNESLGDTLRLFSELRSVFNQIRGMDSELTALTRFMHTNEGLVEKQIRYVNLYSHKLEEFSTKLDRHLATVNQHEQVLFGEQIPVLVNGGTNGYRKMDRYLGTLERDEQYQFAEALSKDLGNMRGELESLGARSIEINARLLDELSRENKVGMEVGEQVRKMNENLKEVVAFQSKSLMNSPVFQFFVYTGMAAFVTGIVSGWIYLIHTFLS